MILAFAQNTLSVLWYTGITLSLYAGWMVRDQRYLIAESGLGYWLGIVGGLMMLLLLVYPLRKRKTHWRFIGSVKFWFRFHMILGVLGPVLIIYHSGYRLGSLNSRVAFVSMLIVAASGLVGRYLYRRIHHGLYGKKVSFQELYHRDDDWEQQLTQAGRKVQDVIEELQNVEQLLLSRHSYVNRSLWYYLSLRWKINRMRRALEKGLNRREDDQRILDRLSSLRAICKLGINEVLFSYWHVLHFPLFIMLVISGITHVVVVHFY